MEEGGLENSNSLYRECLRNHAASLGSYATDGCEEFTVDNMSLASLQCVACGCHRNFHRKLKYPHLGGHKGLISYITSSRGLEYPETTADMIDYCGGGGDGRLLVLDGSGKKRFRSKFTADQKEKMLGFAEKIGWKLQRKDLDEEIERFCRSIGVSRQVFKVWMHNHKNSSSSSSASNGNVSSLTQ